MHPAVAVPSPSPAQITHNAQPMSSHPLPTVATQVLRIPADAAQAPLSAQQQEFNALTQRIAQQRQWLQDWEQAVQACRTRYARDGAPLRVAYVDLQAQLAEYLDAQAARKLSKLERQVLEAQLLESAEQAAALSDTPAQRAAMQALVQRYSPPDEDESTEPEADVLPASNAPAAAPEDVVDWDDPEAVAQYVEAQTQAAAAKAQRARQAHQAQRQRKKQKAAGPTPAEQATQSLRDVYRRLASRLHPDREPDAQERARKTELMQRVNIAYEAGRLMELLELQWEVECIDPRALAQLSDVRLAHYNRVLQEQLQDLQSEAQRSMRAFAYEFGLDEHTRYQPHKLMPHVRERLQQWQAATEGLRALLRALDSDPDMLRTWLKHARSRASHD